MHTVGTIVQILGVVFLALHLFAHPEDWRRYAVTLVALAVLFVLAMSLHDVTARYVVAFAGLMAIGVAIRVYDARRPNRSRTRR